MIMANQIKDLGFVDISRVRPGMQYPIGIHRECLAVSFRKTLIMGSPDPC
jgi:hypothetical protein